MIKRSHVIAAAAIPASVVLAWACLVALRPRPAAAPPPVAETKPGGGAEKGEKVGKAGKRLAVTAEQFDAMGGLLDRLGDGYQYETIDEETLGDPKACARFAAIFLTCAEAEVKADDPTLTRGLRAFVSAGGTLYASDLRFDTLAAAFPEFVDRASVAQGLRQEVRAAVTSDELRAEIGPEIALHFRLDGWRPAAFRGDDVRVLLKGRFKTTAGVSIEAPLLVKFPVGQGAVVFTSFHNEKRSSRDEAKLLKYLTLKTVTAALESRETSQLADDGFAPRAVVTSSADPQAAPVTRTFEHAKSGPIRFRLGFEKSAARMRLEVVSPDGKTTTERGDTPLVVDVPRAAPGRWQYTVAVEDAPYPEFPSVLIVGAADASGALPAEKANPTLRDDTPSGNVRFEEVSMGNKPREKAQAARPPRIAVTTPKFDDMGRLLRALGDGYHYEEVDPKVLPKVGSLGGFDIVFLTCDGWPSEWGETTAGSEVRTGISVGRMRPEIADRVGRNLSQFVKNGGTLYASDLRKELVLMAFPDRVPPLRLDLDAYDALEGAERDWIKAVSPGVGVGTVSETIKALSLGKEFKEKHENLIITLELSPLVKNMPGLASPGNNGAGVNPLLGLLLGVNVPTVRRENNAVNDATVRSTLEAQGFRPSGGDVAAITRALSQWKTTITAAARSRPKAKVEKSWPQITRASRKLVEIRGQLIKAVDGAGRQTVTAQVEDSGLKDLVGDTLNLNFADNSWDAADFVGQDVHVLMRGEYTTTTRRRNTAPLLVKFPEGQGTVIFTSFHNEAQNNQQELALLRYLVFTAVTAREEAIADQKMLTGGFSPVKRVQGNHAAGNASVTRTYQSTDAGPIRFGLTFTGSGASLRLTLIAPGGQKYEKVVDSTLIVEATGAPKGEWSYSVESLKVPYENFPFSVSIGKSEPPPKTRPGR